MAAAGFQAQAWRHAETQRAQMKTSPGPRLLFLQQTRKAVLLPVTLAHSIPMRPTFLQAVALD